MNTKRVEDGIVCEFCGTHCYKGAEHNARVEDNARFNDPQPVGVEDGMGPLSDDPYMSSSGQRYRNPAPAESPTTARAEANEDAASVWKRRAWNIKKQLDEIQGGSAEWETKPRALRADNGDPNTIVPAPAPHKKHPGYPK